MHHTTYRSAFGGPLIDKPLMRNVLADLALESEAATTAALSAADSVIVPVQCEYLALEGLTQLMATIDLVRANLNPKLALLGLVLLSVEWLLFHRPTRRAAARLAGRLRRESTAARVS